MDSLTALLPAWVQHHVFWVLVILWLLSNMAGALPTPKNGNQFYKFFFSFVHATFGALPRIVFTLMPQSWLARFMSGQPQTPNPAPAPQPPAGG